MIEGVNVDALANAVQSCPAVEDLDPGPLGGIATYLPGRQLAGIRIEQDRLTIQVRGAWEVPLDELAAQVRRAVAALVGERTVDIIVAALSDPGAPQHTARTRTAAATTPQSTSPGAPTPGSVTAEDNHETTDDAECSRSTRPDRGVEPVESDRSLSPHTSVGLPRGLALRSDGSTTATVDTGDTAAAVRLPAARNVATPETD